MHMHDSIQRMVTWRKIKILHIQNGGRPPSGYCNLATFQRIFVRLAPYLVWRSWITHRHRSCDQNSKFRKFKMADACHFENVYVIWHISGNKKAKINVKNCSLSTTYNGDMTHRKQQKWWTVILYVVLITVLLFRCPTALLQYWIVWLMFFCCSLTLHIILSYENCMWHVAVETFFSVFSVRQ